MLWGSALMGYLLRRWPQVWVSRVLTFAIWAMLFAIGVEVGGNELLVASLGTLGVQALLITLLTTLSCSVGAMLLWHRLKLREGATPLTSTVGEQAHMHTLWTSMSDSFTTFACFACGCLLGYLGADAYLPSKASYYSLCVLLLCVGFGIGQSEEVRRTLRHLDRRLVLTPLITILGTWVGALLVSLLLRGRSVADWLAVSSGFGYYSLSSMLISEMRDVELGTLALMYNVLREITTLLFAPLLLRLFGPLAPISIGGATTADTTLPIISRVCGPQFVALSIAHGLLVDFSVPLLVTLFCTV